MTVNPILVVFLSFFLLKERITWRKSAGVILGAAGAVLLTLAAGTGNGDSLLGDLFILINASSYAFYLVFVKRLMAKYKPLTVITYVFTFGLIYVSCFPPAISELSVVNFANFPAQVLWKVLFVVVGVTFLTYLLTVYSLKHLSPSVSSTYIYLQPVLVIFFAYFFSVINIVDDYTDTITMEKVLYMLFIFLGIYLTSSSRWILGRKRG